MSEFYLDSTVSARKIKNYKCHTITSQETKNGITIRVRGKNPQKRLNNTEFVVVTFYSPFTRKEFVERIKMRIKDIVRN